MPAAAGSSLRPDRPMTSEQKKTSPQLDPAYPYGTLFEGIHLLSAGAGTSTDPYADELSSHYSGVSEDDSLSGPAREAALLFCVAQGHLREGEGEEALKAATDVQAQFQKLGDKSGVADALRLVVSAYCCQHMTQQATDKAAEELGRFKKAGDKRGEASMKLALGEVQLSKYDAGAALDLMEEALAISRGISDKRMEATIQLGISNAEDKKSNPKDAIRAAQAAQELFAEAKDKRGQANALHALAEKSLKTDLAEEALQAAKAALALFNSLEDQRSEVAVLETLVDIQIARGDSREAHRIASEALELCRKIGNKKGESVALCKSVNAYLERGDYGAALRQARDGKRQFFSEGHKKEEAIASDALVETYLAQSLGKDALATGWEAMEIRRDLNDKTGHPRSILMVSMLHLVNSHDEWALQAALEAGRMYTDMGDKEGQGFVRYALLSIHTARDEPTEALDAAKEAEALFRAIENRKWMASTCMMLCRTHRQTGDIKAAITAAGRARWMYEEAGDKKAASAALLTACHMHLQMQEPQKALQFASRSQKMVANIQHIKSRTTSMIMLGSARLANGEPETAYAISQEARTLSRKIEDRLGEGKAMQLLVSSGLAMIMKQAEVLEAIKPDEKEVVDEPEINYGADAIGSHEPTGWKQEGDPIQDARDKQMGGITILNEKALGFAKEATFNAGKADDKDMHIAALHLQAQVEMMSHLYDDALKSCKDALAMEKEVGDKHWECLTTILTSEINYVSGKGELALEAVESGLKMCRKNGDVFGEQYAQNVLEMLTGDRGGGEAKAAGEGGGDDGGGADEVAVFQGLDPQMVRDQVRETVAQLVGLEDDGMYDDTPLMDSGMDSLSSVEFRNQLVKDFKMNLPSTLTFDFPSIKMIMEYIVEESKAASPEAKAESKADGGGGKKKSDAGAAARAGAPPMVTRKGPDMKIKNPSLVGTWDSWKCHPMTWEASTKSYGISVQLGINGWESFQILCNDDWEKCIHPDQADGSPHVAHLTRGPDEKGHGLNWTVGKAQQDKGAEGVCYKIKLFQSDSGTADRVEWERLGASEGRSIDVVPGMNISKEESGAGQPYLIGTWNDWSTPLKMTHDPGAHCYKVTMKMGKQGWESFQVLLGGQWRRCFAPDRKDGCPHPHSVYEIVGTDTSVHGKNWTVGKHPLDHGGDGVSYQIRLYLKEKGIDRGNPDKLDWVKI